MGDNTAIFFATPQEAGEFLAKEVRANDLILVKGSRGVKTEVVVGKLKEDRGVLSPEQENNKNGIKSIGNEVH